MVVIKNIKLVGNVITADCYINGRIYFHLEFNVDNLITRVNKEATYIPAIDSYAGKARNKIMSEWKETGTLSTETCAAWY